MLETGTVVLHTAETQGSLFLASMAEGYLGDDKLKIGAVDLRGPLGFLAQGYGLYQTMTGQKGAGAHVLAVGNGLMGSMLASIARNVTVQRRPEDPRGGPGDRSGGGSRCSRSVGRSVMWRRLVSS